MAKAKWNPRTENEQRHDWAVQQDQWALAMMEKRLRDGIKWWESMKHG